MIFNLFCPFSSPLWQGCRLRFPLSPVLSPCIPPLLGAGLHVAALEVDLRNWMGSGPASDQGWHLLFATVYERSIGFVTCQKVLLCSLVSPDNSAEWRKDFSADWLFTCFTFSGFEPSEQSCFNDSQICVKVLVFSFISFPVYFSL